jgi:hypothetical protein
VEGRSDGRPVAPNPSDENQRLAIFAHFDSPLHEMMDAKAAPCAKIVDDTASGAIFHEHMFHAHSSAVQRP